MLMILLFSLSLSIALIYTTICILKYKKRTTCLQYYVEHIAILEKAKEIAYQKMFKDHILVYSSSGFRINKDELEKVQREFVKLVFRICGPSIMEDLKVLHGDLDSITVLLINELIIKIEQDESLITERMSNPEDDAFKEKIEVE